MVACTAHLSKSLPNTKILLHLYSQFDIEHHMIFAPNC